MDDNKSPKPPTQTRSAEEPQARGKPVEHAPAYRITYFNQAELATDSSEESDAPRIVYFAKKAAGPPKVKTRPIQASRPRLPSPELVSLTPTPQSSPGSSGFLHREKGLMADTATSAYRPDSNGVQQETRTPAAQATSPVHAGQKRLRSVDTPPDQSKRANVLTNYVRTAYGHVGRDALDTLMVAAATGKKRPTTIKEQIRYLFGDQEEAGKTRPGTIKEPMHQLFGNEPKAKAGAANPDGRLDRKNAAGVVDRQKLDPRSRDGDRDS
jgi:hypothetical protein